MDDNKRQNSKVIISGIIAIFIMVVAVVVLAYDNEILLPGSNDLEASWRVEFTSIAEAEKKGSASSRQLPYYTSTYASFYVDFVQPGDEMTYELQISNLGTLDAKLTSINYITNPYEGAIKYELIDISEGLILKAGEVKNFKIKISYELSSSVGTKFDKPISILFSFTQVI